MSDAKVNTGECYMMVNMEYHEALKQQNADLVEALKACVAEIQDVLDENPNSIHLGLLIDQAEQALGLGKEE